MSEYRTPEWVAYTRGQKHASFTLGDLESPVAMQAHYEQAPPAESSARRRLASAVHMGGIAINVDIEPSEDNDWVFHAGPLLKHGMALDRLAEAACSVLGVDPALSPIHKGIEVLDSTTRGRIHPNQFDLLDNFERHVIYEDPDIFALNKPGHVSSIWDSYYHIGASEIAKVWRPSSEVAHRIDRPTSGVLLFGKNSAAQAHLGGQFAREEGAFTVQKRYLALVEGQFGDDQSIRLFLRKEQDNKMKASLGKTQGARIAKTTARNILTVETPEGPRSLLDVQIHTGRQHQIRVSMAAIGLPLVHDHKYGRPSQHRLRLHAHAATFMPMGGEEPVTVRAPLPDDFFSDMDDNMRRQIEDAVDVLSEF